MGDNDTDWYPDPSGRFEERFLLRGEWSPLVRSDGEESVDHPGELPLPAGITTLVSAGAEPPHPLTPGSALPPPPPPSAPWQTESPASPLTGSSAPADASSLHPTDTIPPPPPGADKPHAHLPPPPTTGPARRGSRFARGLTTVVSIVVVIALMGLGSVAYKEFAASGPSWPDAWDPQVVGLVGFVEAQRGLRFEHPVTITYLTDDQFDAFLLDQQQQGRQIAATVGSAVSSPGATDARQAAEGKLHALGLYSGSLDLGEATRDLSTGIVGLYTSGDQTIRLRGSDLTPVVKLTLGHELTHALQDQHFGIAKLWRSVTADTGAEALTALLEGDARRVEAQLYKSMTPEEQASVDQLQKKSVEGGSFDEAPVILQVSLDAPYTLGSQLVRSLLANGGNDAVDEAFTRLPESVLSLFNPIDHLARVELGHVEAPVLPEELKALDAPTTLGPLVWFLTASTRLDISQALDLADLWRGDQTITYARPDGVTCVRSAITTNSIDDTGRLQALLTAWAAGVPAPAEPPTIGSNKVSVVVDSCDQSGSTPADLDRRIATAYAVAAKRASIWASMLESDPDIDLPTVECYGNYVVRAFTPDEILAPADPTPQQQAVLDTARQACAADPKATAPPPTATVPGATSDSGGSAPATGPSL